MNAHLRHLLAILLLTGTFAAAHAAAPPPRAGFDARFVQTRSLPGFSTPLVSHGILRFDAAHGFHWEITAPYHYVFEMRDGRAQEQLPDGSTRTLDPDQTPWLAAVQHIFVSALAGRRDDLERYFTLAITPLAHGQRIRLTPKAGPIAQAIASIEVTESAPGHPERLLINETSGGRMEIRFTPAAAP